MLEYTNIHTAQVRHQKIITENFQVVQHVITVLEKLTVIIFYPVLSQTCTSIFHLQCYFDSLQQICSQQQSKVFKE